MGTKLIFTTISRSEAVKLAKKLVEEKVAACVNIVDIRSIYRWEGKIYDDEEALLIIKVPEEGVENAFNFIRSNHPYELPEIIVLGPEKVLEEYDKWVFDSCS